LKLISVQVLQILILETVLFMAYFLQLWIYA
jgi:hypothetical protein